jgi:periplasmic protein TonB
MPGRARVRWVGVACAAGMALGACGRKPLHASAWHGAASTVHPDEAPTLVNAELPFQYPASLYARKVQGNVTLRLFVDRDGRTDPESTRVEETSGYPALDSAAVAGSRDLRFVPAKLRGEPVPLTILLPVWFRHPQARPLAGDSAAISNDRN